MSNDGIRCWFYERAPRLQHAAIYLSVLVGGLVGASAAGGWFWGNAFGGFISQLLVGMAAVVAAAAGERVAPNDWLGGLRLSARIFLSQTTVYGIMVLGLAVLVTAPAQVPDVNPARLALQMLPGLYLCTLLAILLSGPLYLRWLPSPADR